MIATQIMTQMAEAAALRYGFLLDGWRSIYLQAINGALTPATIREVLVGAHLVAENFRRSEDLHITEDTDLIASDALRATFDELGVDEPSELTEPVSELVSAIEQYLQHEIATQIARDIAFLQESLRRTLLQVSVAARSQGLPMRAAQMQYVIGNAHELQFFFHDRRGAKWPSRKFIRGVYRHALLSIYNETVLLTLADHGEATALVEHASSSAHEHGMVVAMAPNGRLPIYGEIRNEIFHPNSDAILRKAV